MEGLCATDGGRASDPRDAGVRATRAFRLALREGKLGHREESAARFEEALAALLDAGQPRRAEAAVAALLGGGWLEPASLLRLAELAGERGLPAAAARLSLEAVGTALRCGDAELATRTLERLAPGALVLHPAAAPAAADYWCALGSRERAARTLAAAAESLRREGRPAEAVALYRRLVDMDGEPEASDRGFGLALLAQGRDDDAQLQLERWLVRDPAALEARVWWIEASWGLGHEQHVRVSVAELARYLGVSPGAPDAWSRLLAGIAPILEGEPALVECRIAPFWEAEDLAETLCDGSVLPHAAGASAARPRVFVAGDVPLARLRLVRALREAGFDVHSSCEDLPLVDALRKVSEPLDLVILSIPAADAGDLVELARLRAEPRLQEVPLLGVAALDQPRLDLDGLRALGVTGLIDRRSAPSDIVSRAAQLARCNGRRRFARAPAFFPIDLEVDGFVTTEFASNLSIGGMRATSARPLERNTDVRVRFSLPSQPREAVEVDGRVIYLQVQHAGLAPYEIGLFFYPMGDCVRERLLREVEALLRP
jgi:tetratricopeptide (TPR) repeat protein